MQNCLQDSNVGSALVGKASCGDVIKLQAFDDVACFEACKQDVKLFALPSCLFCPTFLSVFALLKELVSIGKQNILQVKVSKDGVIEAHTFSSKLMYSLNRSVRWLKPRNT